MDYTKLRKTAIDFACAKCSIDPKCFDLKNTFYYDETDNIKKFRIRESGFNVASDCHFVLGGVTTECNITFEELKNVWGFQNDNDILEIKSTNKSVFKGSFADILKSSKLSSFIQLLIEKSCYIHFYNLNILYYSLVDIVDSVSNTDLLPFYDQMKTMLYLIFKEDLTSSASLLYKYNYPNIKDSELLNFLKDIIILIDSYSNSENHLEYAIPLCILKKHIQFGLQQNALPFIQDNVDHEPIEGLGDFYLQKLYMYPYAKHVFDNEEYIKGVFDNKSIEIDGHSINNYCFVDSKSNVLIQVSDLIVAILKRYFKFCDRSKESVDSDINHFTDQQMNSFVMLNKILKNSLDYNPVYMHHSTNLIEYENFNYLINEYGK